jgi:hypothetical protein
MATYQDDNIDEMLKARRIQAASPDLAQRIILKAQMTPRMQAFSLGGWIKQTFAELHLPNPVYVLAGTLMMGFVLGWSLPSDSVTDNTEAFQIQSFLESDEGIL